MKVPGPRGFTMIELMVSIAVLGIFSSVILGLSAQAAREQRLTSSYQRDLDEGRAALRSIEDDLRAARRVEVQRPGANFRVAHAEGWVEYSLAAGELCRVDAQGHERTLAQCIAAVDLRTDCAMARVVLEIRARSQPAPKRGARLVTSVAMRNWEGR